MTGLEQGDLVEVSFDPTVGHEPQKTRPSVVLSSFDFNAGSSLTVVAPITSIDNGYPLHVRISDDNNLSGFVCVEQLRSIDLNRRKARRVGALDDATMLEVMSLLRGVFNI